MWYPALVVVPPAVEPITLNQAKEQCGLLSIETHADALLQQLVKSARAHVEKICNAVWAPQTIESTCDRFGDLIRLPLGPISSVEHIKYVDPMGATQTLSVDIFDVRKDGLEPSIALKHGQSWPRVQPGSRISLRGIFGGDVPDDVRQAILMIVAHWYLNREAIMRKDDAALNPVGVDWLLCNHRRGE